VAIDKDFFAQQTTSAIVAKMDAQRAGFLEQIVKQQKIDIDQYGLEQALKDVLAYDDRGTIQSAVISLNAQAGSDKTNAETQLDNTVKGLADQDRKTHGTDTIHSPSANLPPTSTPSPK
jgi:hypothetical protein